LQQGRNIEMLKKYNVVTTPKGIKRLWPENLRSIGGYLWIGLFVLFFLCSCTLKDVSYYRREEAPPCKVKETPKKISSKSTKEIPIISDRERVQYGVASWYGSDFHGKKTASGEIYDMYAFTAAHLILPMGTHVMVTNLSDSSSVEVVINDRGPFVKGRVIDLSYCAAMALGIIDKGTAEVRLEILDKGPVAKKASFNNVMEGFTIQVASYSREESALFLKEALQEEFPEVRITTFRNSTQRFYRVRIGEFIKKSDAAKVAEKLINMGYSAVIISLSK
jgi:rare lipoprotein A